MLHIYRWVLKWHWNGFTAKEQNNRICVQNTLIVEISDLWWNQIGRPSFKAPLEMSVRTFMASKYKLMLTQCYLFALTKISSFVEIGRLEEVLIKWKLTWRNRIHIWIHYEAAHIWRNVKFKNHIFCSNINLFIFAWLLCASLCDPFEM